MEPVRASSNPKEKSWGVFVFMASNNDLYRYGYDNLKELEKIGSSPEADLVAQMDHKPSMYEKLPIKSRDVICYHAEKGASSVIKNLGPEVSQADGETLRSFLIENMKQFPSKSSLLVICDHGGGFTGAMKEGKKLVSLPEMREALERAAASTGRKLDILAFDACLMSQVEVAYEFKDLACYLIASEETEFGSGWIYDRALHNLEEKSPRQLAETVVNHIAEGEWSVRTCTATDLEEMPRLKEGVNAFARTVMGVRDPEERESLRRILTGGFAFGERAETYGDFRDLGDTLKGVLIYPGPGEKVRNEARKLLGIYKGVIASHRSEPIEYGQATGLSIYAPRKLPSPDLWSQYKATLWAKETLWDEMLEWLHQGDPRR